MKINFYVLFFLLITISIRSNPILIGVAEPYIYNQSSSTLYIRNNLIFELYTLMKDNTFSIYTITDSTTKHSEYFAFNINYVKENNIDYLLTTECYSFGNTVFLHTKLIDPQNGKFIFSSNDNIDFNIQINESLNLIANNIIKKILMSNLLKKSPTKVVENKTNRSSQAFEKINDLILSLNIYPKHEIFTMNGFLRNNSIFFSLLSVYMGYSYYLSDGFFIDIGVSGGAGLISDSIPRHFYSINDYFAGVFTGAHVYLKGILEPNFGLRVELFMTDKNKFFMTIPIDIGLKIFISKNNILKLNFSFPFNTFDILNNDWKKSMTLGMLIGYGIKIK